MIQADVYYRKSDHLTRLLTGLHILEEKGILSCRYFEDAQHRVLPATACVVELRIEGKRIVFDLGDASGLNQAKLWDYLRNVDAYFERSHKDWSTKPVSDDQLKKIHPFGFNYYTTYPGNPAYDRSSSGSMIKRMVRNVVNGSRFTKVKVFEGKANFKTDKPPRILFMARLWDPDSIIIRPDDTPEEQQFRKKRKEERKKINADRIQICRSLRQKYGSNFCGGIQNSELAQSLCPDLILPTRMTLKTNYLKRMKNADICIGSAGLEQSIGWKTGEYVAAARAIVCEELAYLLPGDFEKGVNYLPYTDAEGCIAAVDHLCEHPELIYQMQLANENYYQRFLRPDVQILNALRVCDINV